MHVRGENPADHVASQSQGHLWGDAARRGDDQGEQRAAVQPGSLTAAYYTRWLGRISTYLDAAGARALASE
jgi:hypothetical protein